MIDRRSPETDDAALPFWSPDSKSIGFFTEGKLQRIDIEGGQPQALTEVKRGQGGNLGRRRRHRLRARLEKVTGRKTPASS